MRPTLRVRHTTKEVLLTLGAVAGALCAVLAVLALVLDLRVLAFRSGSMSPTIPTGALAVARTVPAAELHVGDVVTVRTAGGDRVTHRVVRIERYGDRATLELRGDANTVADVTPYDVARADRVLFSVPWLGYLGGMLLSPIGLILLGIYAALLLRLLFAASSRARRGSPRHRHSGVAAAALVLVTAMATGTLGARSSLTSAAWLDAAATTGSTFGTGSVPVPATFSCGLVGLFSVSFVWTAVSGATSYVLHYGAGGGQTVSTTATSRTITAGISGGTAWVTASRNYGSTTWTSGPSNTRSYSVIAISLCS